MRPNEPGRIETIMDLCFYILIAAVIGSRLFYVIINPAEFFETPLEIFKIWKGGLFITVDLLLQ